MWQSIFFELLWLLQPDVTSGAPSAGGGGTKGPTNPLGGPDCAMQAGMLLVLMAFLYFFMIRPEQKRRKEHESLVNTLSKGTKVRTNGGLLGEVVSVREVEAGQAKRREVIVSIADKVRVNVLASHIASVEKDEASTAAEKKA